MLGLQLLRLPPDAYVRHGGNVGSLTPHAEPSRQTAALRCRPAGASGGHCHYCLKFSPREKKKWERNILKCPSVNGLLGEEGWRGMNSVHVYNEWSVAANDGIIFDNVVVVITATLVLLPQRCPELQSIPPE